MIITPESYGAIGDGIVNDRVAWMKTLDAAQRTGAKIVCRPAANYYVLDQGAYDFVGDGTTTDFVLTGCEAVSALNLLAKVCDETNSAYYDINSGHVMRPEIDFTYEPTTQTISFAVPPPDVAFTGPNPESIRIVLEMLIQRSDVEIDGRGCTFSGNARFLVEGAPTTQGQIPPVTNVYLHDFRASIGPRFQWTRGCLGQRIHKRAMTGTAFNIHFSLDTHFKDCSDTGSYDGFSWLITDSTDCSVENFYTTDLEGEENNWALVGQIKGGFRCKAIRAVAENCTAKPPAETESMYAFYMRGDKPGGETWDLGVYPYPTGEWSSADPQRYTREGQFVDCVVSYTRVLDRYFDTAFHFQEQRDGVALRCVTQNAGGFAITKAASDEDSGPSLVDCEVFDCTGRASSVVGKSTSDRLEGAVFSNFLVDGCAEDGIYCNFADSPVFTNVQLLDGSVTPIVRVLNSIGTAFEDATVVFTTADSTTVTLANVSLADGSYTLLLDVVGEVAPSSLNSWVGSVDVTVSGGVITMSSPPTGVNPDSLGGLHLDSSGANLRIRVQGKTSTTVEWSANFDLA